MLLYGYQGADREAEKLALTDQLLDAAFGELGVVAREQPCLVVGDFNVEPTKILCLAKGISAGLWVDLEAAWAFASGRQPGCTCKRSWALLVGPEDFFGGLPSCCCCCFVEGGAVDMTCLNEMARVRSHESR